MKRPVIFRRRSAQSASLVAYLGATYGWMAIIIILVSAACFLWYRSACAEQMLRSTAQTAAQTVAAATAPTWQVSQTGALDAAVQEAATLPNIAYVQVRQPNGAVLVSAGNMDAAPQDIWIETAPVVSGTQQLGTVEVAVLRTAGQVLPNIGYVLAASIAATVVSALAASVLAYRTTTKPLRSLQAIAARWEQPQIINHDWEEGPREIQELGRAIMDMRSRALARTNQLAEQVMQRTQELTEAYNALDESFLGTAAALAQALDARDHLTANHANRTAHLVSRIAKRMGFSESEQRTLVLAATLHDIGKIGVPESILTKPGILTAEEMAIMRLHPVISANILEPVSGMEEVAQMVRHHHERWDGKGYPDGLAGTEIPLGSRILALADTVEAMSARRHYREPLSPEAILAEIRRCSGSQFDPDVVRAGWDEIVRTLEHWCRSEPETSSDSLPFQDVLAACRVPGGSP